MPSLTVAPKPYTVAEKEDAPGSYAVNKVTEVDQRIVSIIGDVLQNLRSALDHLTIHLLCIRLGVDKTDPESHFPVRDTADKYKTKMEGVEQTLGKDVADLMRAVEAHEGGNGHLIWVLHRLNNIDKHRIIVAVGSGNRSINLGGIGLRSHAPFWQSLKDQGIIQADTPVPVLSAFFKPADNLCPLKVGDVLLTGVSRNEVDVDNDFRFEIAFNEPGFSEGDPIIKTLQKMRDLVSATVDSFRPCLSKT